MTWTRVDNNPGHFTCFYSHFCVLLGHFYVLLQSFFCTSRSFLWAFYAGERGCKTESSWPLPGFLGGKCHFPFALTSLLFAEGLLASLFMCAGRTFASEFCLGLGLSLMLDLALTDSFFPDLINPRLPLPKALLAEILDMHGMNAVLERHCLGQEALWSFIFLIAHLGFDLKLHSNLNAFGLRFDACELCYVAILV